MVKPVLTAASLSRRAFLAQAAIAGAAIAGIDAHPAAQIGAPFDPWRTVDAVLRRIHSPTFPRRTFDIRRFGARSDGGADSTDSIRRAISACAAAGGGRVVVPAGRFVTGAVRLQSKVNLHLEDGATLAFSRDANAYLPLVLTRFEGIELMNYSPFIYALDAHDVAITGPGTLDGQANEEFWWSWRGARPRRPLAADASPKHAARNGGKRSRARRAAVWP